MASEKLQKVLAGAAIDLRHSSFDLRHSSFVIRHSSFVIRHSSFVIRPSSFDLRHSTFVIRHSTFVIRHSSFVIRHSASRARRPFFPSYLLILLSFLNICTVCCMRRCPVAVPFLYRCCPVAVRIAVCVAVPPASRLGSHPSSPQRFRMGVAVSLRVPILSRFAVHRCDGNAMLIAQPPVSVCVPSLSASVYRWPHGPDRNARICRALRSFPLSRFVSQPYPPRAAVLSFLIYLSRRCPRRCPILLPSRIG